MDGWMDGRTDLLGLLVKLREHCSFSFGPTLHFGLRNDEFIVSFYFVGGGGGFSGEEGL